MALSNSLGLAVRWRQWRNRVIASRRFQAWAARTPLVRRIARRRAGAMFDRVAGFTYSQVLLAAVESGLIDQLAGGPVEERRLVPTLGSDARRTLLRASAALDLAEQVAPGWWMLGNDGAVLHADAGIQAMIRHHPLLYADLADPLALLADDRRSPTALSRYWHYARDQADADADRYSALMAASQAMVAAQVIAAYRFDRHDALLDVGGGHGVFLGAVGNAFPSLRRGLFDLPAVIAGAGDARVATHPGDFFADPLPRGYDLVSLVRILHDHDDEPAAKLLRNIRAAMAPGSMLLIAEPMAGVRGAEAMADAYFGLYLWAMRSGRPRRPEEIGAMLDDAGFARWKRVATNQPVITSLIVATK
ncbi:methyltransferase [Sphingomonas sp. ASV193]|uniref:methyltransferase n=1 Tax=Sphingomonas sp. ASV193 TaxID=3144405 RepID=UPI0032E85D39